ncbi:hypothetical protein HHL22_13210 [Hymenobacter sp. RP-2-7]|uniref:DUF3887 domain-containing protein n=1 Tax=Hymenobacter polaris TaxID=2682546 RepID=A0A7Y0FN68_9BACT|nr:hypothetical protein [Hymenobacter polaris]NML66165.1 hypothetical protein [Hymenobacter polaris]
MLALGAQAPAPTQPQMARRFLLDVLRADYPAAYQRLAPDVKSKLPLAAFIRAARPLTQLGRRRGQAIELYKLGTWLGAPSTHEPWFYCFSFAQDSLLKSPKVLLEVTFRDTATRQVLGFRLRGQP